MNDLKIEDLLSKIKYYVSSHKRGSYYPKEFHEILKEYLNIRFEDKMSLINMTKDTGLSYSLLYDSSIRLGLDFKPFGEHERKKKEKETKAKRKQPYRPLPVDKKRDPSAALFNKVIMGANLDVLEKYIVDYVATPDGAVYL